MTASEKVEKPLITPEVQKLITKLLDDEKTSQYMAAEVIKELGKCLAGDKPQQAPATELKTAAEAFQMYYHGGYLPTAVRKQVAEQWNDLAYQEVSRCAGKSAREIAEVCKNTPAGSMAQTLGYRMWDEQTIKEAHAARTFRDAMRVFEEAREETWAENIALTRAIYLCATPEEASETYAAATNQTNNPSLVMDSWSKWERLSLEAAQNAKTLQECVKAYHSAPPHSNNPARIEAVRKIAEILGK